MFATFGYDACSGKVIGSIEDNGYYYGQILEQTSMEQISKPQGILVSLTPTLRDQGYGAYVHEVRSEDGNSGYLSHVTIHQGPEGAEVGGFELVKDQNGHYSNALYGCDELDDMSWFKRKPEYGGKGGWDRWGGHSPTFDINEAWVKCDPEPEQQVQFKIIMDAEPVQTSGDGDEAAVEGGGRGGNPAYREHQNAKKNAAPVVITKTRNGSSQPETTGVWSGNEGYRAPLPAPRGGNEGYKAYEKRQADAEAETFSPATAELQERVLQGRLHPGQQKWQERVAQGLARTEVVIDSRAAKREVEKRELSKEEIKAMQDRDLLRRPQADKTQFKPAVKADKEQGKKINKRTNKPTPERSAKIKFSDFSGWEHAMDVLAHGVDHEDIQPAMGKVEANPTPVAEPTAAIEAMQEMQRVQASQSQKRAVAWNPDKLGQNKLTARAMVPEGPRETIVRRYHTTAW